MRGAMQRSDLDTNIEYFARHIAKIRRNVGLVCIFLIIVATVPYILRQFSVGWDIAGSVQTLVLIMFIGVFVRVFRVGYSHPIGSLILVADVVLIGLGIFTPGTQPIIVMFFFTPPLIAYLFFPPGVALTVSLTSYICLNGLFFQRFIGAEHPHITYVFSTIIFAGIAFVIGLHLVVASRRDIERKLMEVAHLDALTGLPNRMHFESRIDQEIERSRREELPLCFGIVDLDHFKNVNDTYGHDCGDMVLKHVATVLSGSLRAQDILCRFGGEEMVIVMPNTTIEDALPSLERVRASISDCPVLWKGNTITVTTSIGVSELSMPSSSYDALFVTADKNLYIAKENGRNQVVGSGIYRLAISPSAADASSFAPKVPQQSTRSQSGKESKGVLW